MSSHAPRLVGLLIRTAADLRNNLALDRGGMTVEELLPASSGRDPGLSGGTRWWRVAIPESMGFAGGNPWDVARERAEALGFAGEGVFVEPDLEQRFPAFPPDDRRLGAAGSKARPGAEDPLDARFPPAGAAPYAWHLGPDFSQLARAREAVPAAAQAAIRIAHLDTGFDGSHRTTPVNLRAGLGFDFVDRDGDAADPGTSGMNPGHGTGTLGILAGGSVPSHPEAIGGIPGAEVVPYRIATSVVLFRTSALAEAIRAAISLDRADDRWPGVDVITLSMGGLASQAWAEAVNRAYEAGTCLVAAAGNNFSTGLLPFPTGLIVYPARFRRVIAACGIMADHRPYAGRPAGQMQGNHGPRSKMATALSAFTPNIPWAELGASEIVDLDGAGTSAATPQVAAAAALWLAQHRAELAGLQGWQRVEAVRWALFSSAAKEHDGGAPDRLGNGALRAADALSVGVNLQLQETPADTASLAIFRLFTGLGVAAGAEAEMLALEATQLVQQGHGSGAEQVVLDRIVDDLDLPETAVQPRERRRLLEALAEHPRASRALGAALRTVLGAGAPPGPRRRTAVDRGAPARPPPTAPARPPPHRPRVSPPCERSLRIYAADPSLQLKIDTKPISTAVIAVPWEDDLAPGPVGEYLEVIDLDPASQRVYPPVDLDDRFLLAQDGLDPSEANPQFHQQMVYAVASRTIRSFEQALGRRALWAPRRFEDEGRTHDDSVYVQRLRLHPHALREANAYYSPGKVALLFGYFRAPEVASASHLPGGMVFTCLSHDVVAHETAHALLDGMHRRLIQATNPDMRAFHEAFADVVALLQHFTYPEILEHQISRTRGELRQHSNLLGQLATQFGETTGRRGALRDYIGRRNEATKAWEPRTARPEDYATAVEPHDLGAVLVSAIFDAFLTIYESRTRDLLRLATGGTGVLPTGAIHPDLVRRLANEASRAAGHVLGMCIRALDYCPPADLTFGDYLRAIVTADHDLVRDDDLGYRVAFIDAFRSRGIYPERVKVLSEESLLWQAATADRERASPRLLECFSLLREYGQRHQQAATRKELFWLSREMRRELHDRLKDHLERSERAQADADFLGLEPGGPFEVHSARHAQRVGPDGQLLNQFVIEILQRKPLDESAPDGPRCEGGCAIVIDVTTLQPRYVIRKRVRSERRQQRQRAYLAGLTGRWDTYFAGLGDAEPLAMDHRS